MKDSSPKAFADLLHDQALDQGFGTGTRCLRKLLLAGAATAPAAPAAAAYFEALRGRVRKLAKDCASL